MATTKVDALAEAIAAYERCLANIERGEPVILRELVKARSGIATAFVSDVGAQKRNLRRAIKSIIESGAK